MMGKKTRSISTLRYAFWILFSTQIIFLVICYMLFKTNMYNVSEKAQDIISVISPLISFGSVLIGLIFFQMKLKGFRYDSDVLAKYRKYSALSIVRWAFFQGAIIMSAMSLIISSRLVFLVYAVVIMLFYLLMMPGKSRIIHDLLIEETDLDSLN